MIRSWNALKRTVVRYAALLLPIVGLAELGAHYATSRRAPAFGDWAEIAEPVRTTHQAGDLVLVAPHWAEPLARQALGDELMPLRDLARPDTRRYRSALEISILGQRHADLEGWREVSRSQHGPFELRRVENPKAAPVLVDFVDALTPQRAQVFFGPQAAPCPFRTHAPMRSGNLGGHPTFPAERFECPGGLFYHAAVTVIADQDFRPRRCIWAHPPRHGEWLVRFADVKLGEVISGHGGMYWVTERSRDGAPITLTARVDGRSVGRAVHHDGDGWAGFEFSLGELAGRDGAEVEFAVTAPNNRHRHFCFEAHSR